MSSRHRVAGYLQARSLCDAIRRGRVGLAVQPVFAADAERDILYGECLARLSASEGAAPHKTGDFVLGLEAAGTTPLLDLHMISLVLDQLAYDPSVVLGCNLSASTFASPETWRPIFEQLRARSHLLPRLVIELIETRALSSPAQFVDIVHELRDLGCRIALDDFGTGFASPRLLQLVHFDIVKIDKVFLQDNRYSADGKGSLWHLVQLASCFSPVVVVEGVETNNQVARARAAGATHLQGYLLARPCFIGTGIPAKVPLAAP